MRTSLFWLEFAGVHVAILATVIGIAVAIRMRQWDRAQRLAMTYAFVTQGMGIVLLVSWFLQTDWMLSHYQGPPFLLFSALASLTLGIGAVLLACVLSVAARLVARASRQVTMRVCTCWVLLLILTLASGFLSWGAFGATGRALRTVRLKHFDALEYRGAATIPQLVAGLRDADYLQTSACRLLGRLGPSAKEAVPDLINYLETRNDAYAARSDAIWALGKIGPAAEPAIPVLVRLAEEEQSSWHVRHAVIEALQGMGVPASGALTRVTEFSHALAARQLPAQIDALSSTDPEVVRRAADVLFGMGVHAQAALPVLRNRLAEISQDPAKYDWRWSGARGSIDMAIQGMRRESVERQR